MKIHRFTLCLPGWNAVISAIALFAAPVAQAQYTINGGRYNTTGPSESLSATFTVPDGGVTIHPFGGYVLVNVTGVGQSYSTAYNDAFYLYSDQFASAPQNGHDGGYYQLTFDTTTLVNNNLSRNAKNFIYGRLPVYNPLHNYTFILNTSLLNATQLHFGVSDGGYSDNTGAYNILITQLAQVPEPGSFALLFGIASVGFSVLRNRRNR